ncbi:unnamed protein product [Lactuca saligna]|uniref:Mechanosensitive ion channel protein n=1 Tax=Lactuca saligna TaxID=75948 RepID=A0AA35VBE0_LACSI|nr:unnamed protein product [Lactuca saligna]
MPSSPSFRGKATDDNVDATTEAEDASYNFNNSVVDLENANYNTVWRESSYNFSKDGEKFDFLTSEPPSPPLSRIAESPNNYGTLTPKEVMVYFRDEVIEPQPIRHRRRSNGSGRTSGGGEEVTLCSGNASFKRKSTLMRTKTKSRLMDTPERDKRSGRISKSGILGKGGSEFDEEDPFLDDDLPDEYKQLRYSKWTLLQLFCLILILGGLICTFIIPYFKHKKLYDLVLWKWGVMIMVLICGRLVSGWAIRLLVISIERNFLLRKRVLYFVYGLRNAVQNCLWFGLVLIAWQCIFHEKVNHMTHGKVLPYVTKIWICLLVGTIVWLLKTLLVKVLASSFHVSTYFDRIQESLFNQYVIETLSGLPVIEIQQEQEEVDEMISEVENFQNAGTSLPPDLKANIFKKTGRFIGTPRNNSKSGKFYEVNMPVEDGITIDHLHRLNQKNISAWNMKRLMTIVRTGVLSTLDDQLGKSCDEDESAVQITNEMQAKIAAKRIFCNVAMEGSKRIYIEDLMRFLREDEALKAIRLFDGDSETKGISKALLKNWVVNVYRERRALALSLNDTKTAVKKLHQMFNLATTFEAIIFLFVMHPFDVGDRCEVDGIQMVVEEMNILTTVFLRFDNLKIIYPNSVLATKPISNYYRSPDMGDAVDFCVHVSTPVEKIALMKERITSYIENKSDHWYPAPMIVLRDVDDMNRLKISIWLSHRINFQDMGERWSVSSNRVPSTWTTLAN